MINLKFSTKISKNITNLTHFATYKESDTGYAVINDHFRVFSSTVVQGTVRIEHGLPAEEHSQGIHINQDHHDDEEDHDIGHMIASDQTRHCFAYEHPDPRTLNHTRRPPSALSRATLRTEVEFPVNTLSAQVTSAPNEARSTVMTSMGAHKKTYGLTLNLGSLCIPDVS